jgi:hypothetical protein
MAGVPARRRWRALLPALWGGMLLGVALMAAPDAFATLPAADAGRLVRRLFAQEAYLSLALGLVVFLVEQGAARREAEAGRGSVFSTDMVLALGTLFCTIAGYFALQPLLEAARGGQGSVPFGVLHGVSTGFFGLKTLLVLALAGRRAA